MWLCKALDNRVNWLNTTLQSLSGKKQLFITLYYYTDCCISRDRLRGSVFSQNEDTVCSPVVDQLNGDLICFLAKQLLKSCIPANPGDPKLLIQCNVFNHKSWYLAYDLFLLKLKNCPKVSAIPSGKCSMECSGLEKFVNLPLWLPFSALIWLYKWSKLYGFYSEEEKRGLVRGKQQNMELAYKWQSITFYNRAGEGKAGLGLCGLDETGRTLSTYQGSCDRIHSVFLVLFWLGMDLEKQKDGATDMHVLNCLEWPVWNRFC